MRVKKFFFTFCKFIQSNLLRPLIEPIYTHWNKEQEQNLASDGKEGEEEDDDDDEEEEERE